jgi:cyclopropane fatty-acyl-phospholipid synthase-like methyltransferase
VAALFLPRPGPGRVRPLDQLDLLDVGTGRGLLMIGAARRLTSGKAVGIDIWNVEDLSGNALKRTEDNIRAEGRALIADFHTFPPLKIVVAEKS